jgi:hypothetical protein
MKKSNRYQHQSWYVKLWRRRWYLTIPFVAIKIWWYEHHREMRDEHDWSLTFKQSWGLATGLAQVPMNWVYDWDDMKSRDEEFDEKAYKISFRKGSGLIWVKVDSHPEWVGCGHNKKDALLSLRMSVEFEHGAFSIKDWWLSKHIKFSKTGKL